MVYTVRTVIIRVYVRRLVKNGAMLLCANTILDMGLTSVVLLQHNNVVITYLIIINYMLSQMYSTIKTESNAESDKRIATKTYHKLLNLTA